jgi:proline--tRNA ligase
MHDGQALQCATSHNFGDGFAKAFQVQYLSKNNTVEPVHQTSWGITTRTIGALIMVHGDDSGLVLPPRIAPVQVNIIPIQQNKEGVLDKAFDLMNSLKDAGLRVKVDDSDKTPGFKFADSEVRGIPLRLEIGPKDIEAGQVVLVRRDTREKIVVSFENLVEESKKLLEQIQKDMYNRALTFQKERTTDAKSLDELVASLDKKPGFVRAMWCGCRECEEKLKEYSGITSRCIPAKQEKIADTCVVCGKPATKMVYWGRAY